MRQGLFFFLVIILCVSSCNLGTKRTYLKSESLIKVSKAEIDAFSTKCNASEAYAPDTNNLAHYPVKYIRVNFHYMNSSDGTNNYEGEAAYKYTKDLLHYANGKLKANKPMTLPIGNNTPVLPPRYKYVLTPDPNVPGDKGVYFHYDDSLYYFLNKGKDRNNYSTEVIKKYARNSDSVLNVFYMNHHPDSIASATYAEGGSGIALGSSVKMGIIYDPKTKPWKYSGLLNHEIGHVFSLSHTWLGSDGCDDTPTHKNCWNYTNSGPCKELVSNNVMDYNSNQHAFTPCQIGKVRKKICTIGTFQRNLVKQTWCKLNPKRTIYIDDEIVWDDAKDLEGELHILSGGRLIANCRISMPQHAKIIVYPGGTLVLNDNKIHNSCGEKWAGIEVVSKGRAKGIVQYFGNPIIENTTHSFEIPVQNN